MAAFLGIVSIVVPLAMGFLLKDGEYGFAGSWSVCAVVAAVPAIAGLLLILIGGRRDVHRLRVRLGTAFCAVACAVAVIAVPVSVMTGAAQSLDTALESLGIVHRPQVSVVVGDQAEQGHDADALTASGMERPARAHFIDVGQGDATFIELPDGRCVLVGAGTRAAEPKVAAYIRALGYDRVDVVVATHPHKDHIGGFPLVFESFEVGEVWAPRVDTTSDTYYDFLMAVQQEGLQLQTAAAGKRVAEGAGFSLDLLWPRTNDEFEGLNDYSAILRLDAGRTRMLFCGGASTSSIAGASPGRIDVLKAGHHGSSTSTDIELARALSPRAAVASYGIGNDYDLPDASVLRCLEAVGAQALETGANGNVTVVSDGESITAVYAKEGRVEAGIPVSERKIDLADQRVLDATGDAGQDQAVVYVTGTGTKYHLRDCATARRWSAAAPSRRSRWNRPRRRGTVRAASAARRRSRRLHADGLRTGEGSPWARRSSSGSRGTWRCSRRWATRSSTCPEATCRRAPRSATWRSPPAAGTWSTPPRPPHARTAPPSWQRGCSRIKPCGLRLPAGGTSRGAKRQAGQKMASGPLALLYVERFAEHACGDSRIVVALTGCSGRRRWWWRTRSPRRGRPPGRARPSRRP